MKFLKMITLLLAVLILGGVVVSAGGWFMLRGTPDWYQPDTSSPEQKKTNFARAHSMFTRIENWAGAGRARQIRARESASGPATSQAAGLLSHEASKPFQIEFTDAELNEYFNAWIDNRGRRKTIEKYVNDPRLVIRDGQLILVGSVSDFGTVISMKFEPKVDAQGHLQMNLVQVLGGYLPLPDVAWAKQREKLEKMLTAKLTGYQQAAEFAADGTANGAAASAAMNKLMLAILHRDSADPVVFVPYGIDHLDRSLPAKITAISIHDNTLSMTVEQMTPAERETLLEWLRAPYGTATAMVH